MNKFEKSDDWIEGEEETARKGCVLLAPRFRVRSRTSGSWHHVLVLPSARSKLRGWLPPYLRGYVKVQEQILWNPLERLQT